MENERVYDFKPLWELLWSIGLVAAGTLLTFLVGIDETKIGDPAWWVMVGLSVGRSVAGFLLSVIPQHLRPPNRGDG